MFYANNQLRNKTPIEFKDNSTGTTVIHIFPQAQDQFQIPHMMIFSMLTYLSGFQTIAINWFSYKAISNAYKRRQHL